MQTGQVFEEIKRVLFLILHFSYLEKLYCQDCIVRQDIDMKRRPVTKFDKENMTASKKIDDDVISANCDVIAFFQVMANLQPCGSRITGG